MFSSRRLSDGAVYFARVSPRLAHMLLLLARSASLFHTVPLMTVDNPIATLQVSPPFGFTHGRVLTQSRRVLGDRWGVGMEVDASRVRVGRLESGWGNEDLREAGRGGRQESANDWNGRGLEAVAWLAIAAMGGGMRPFPGNSLPGMSCGGEGNCIGCAPLRSGVKTSVSFTLPATPALPPIQLRWANLPRLGLPSRWPLLQDGRDQRSNPGTQTTQAPVPPVAG